MISNSTALENSISGHSASDLSPIRLIVCDLDGTIVGESNQINPGVKQAIQAAQAKGVQVAIATGRMYQAALRFYQDIGSTLPLMSYQGALMKHPQTGEVLQHLTLPSEAARKLLDYFEQPELRDLLSVHFYIDDRLYVREILPETKLYAERSQVEPISVGDLRLVLDREPTKVLALSNEPAVIDRLLTSLRQEYTPAELYFTKSVATFFEATHPQVNKGAAVRHLAEDVLGLRPENVMTIGDNFNDLEMIQYAGIGVAMGNAPDGVKAVAKWVAPDVEADGAVAAIEQFVLANRA
ncbi:MAG TPA: Cof-type HAD-IIB family hydrolase [Trichocoleus sp.]|jgi:Cof subfamily protein (haloacid dehalogenase superfamily)